MAGAMLDQSEVVHYLLAQGLVKPRHVVEESIAVADASRRNRVFVVSTGDGPAYVVKQAGPEGAATLAHEAAVLRALAIAHPVSAQVPLVVDHDPARRRLVLRTAAGARDWSDNHRGGRFPRLPARALGQALAAVHRLAADDFDARPAGIDPMWGLSLPEPPQRLVLDLSAGATDLVARIQGNRALCDRLTRLREAGVDGVLVHGDLRWDNCLVAAAPGARRATRLVLVDWELAGRGAPAFDVGTVLAEYLRLWVGSIPIVVPSDPGRLAHRARHPLTAMHPAMEAFWSAYREASTAPPPLRRVVELVGVRLLQSAVERSQGLASPSAHVIAQIQLADNLLGAPDDAASVLLGLRG
jgi:Ser/Thr protein kinase RdoA (MazF antagonist)